jgi:hypothetical protein
MDGAGYLSVWDIGLGTQESFTEDKVPEAKWASQRSYTIPSYQMETSLTLPPSVVCMSDICQRKEDFQTRKNSVEGWSHGRPLRGKDQAARVC